MREIAKEAYIYGFPMVDNYRVMYSYFVDTTGPEYKGEWNQVHSTARVYTPADTAIQTPNSDTPYSMLGADLRTEPLVLTVPPIEPGRYYSLQFVDGYTYNIAYVGSRATGNSGGKYLLAGPNWNGETPDGITGVIRSNTELVLVIYRTQLFAPDDIDNVVRIQEGYQATPLSAHLDQPAPAQAPPIDFVPPLTPDQQKTSPKFFDILNFTLQFAPQESALSLEQMTDIEGGIADAWVELGALKTDKIDTGEVTSAQLFGTPEDLAGNYLYRMAGAVFGIYGNTAAEAIYPNYSIDADGALLTGASEYTFRFEPGQLPPVNSFWSLTMYELPQSLLVDNPIDRYLINSAMLPNLVADPDGGYTLYIQNQAPAAERTANWLPAPQGPFAMVLRLYWPKPDALSGVWQAPKPVKV